VGGELIFLPKLSVKNFEKIVFIFYLRMLIYFKFQNLKPFGIADLTASTASNVLPHKQL